MSVLIQAQPRYLLHKGPQPQPTQKGDLNQHGLMRCLASLLHEKREKILRLSGQKGGWEGWLQVELADFINRNNTIPYDAEREQPVFEDENQFIDLWCKHASELYQPDNGFYATRNEPRIGVELKCGGEFQDFFNGSIANLQDRFRNDIRKILAGMDPEKSGECGSRVYATAVTLEKEETIGYEDIAISTSTPVQIWSTDLSRRGYSINLLWWYKDFPKTF